MSIFNKLIGWMFRKEEEITDIPMEHLPHDCCSCNSFISAKTKKVTKKPVNKKTVCKKADNKKVITKTSKTKKPPTKKSKAPKKK